MNAAQQPAISRSFYRMAGNGSRRSRFWQEVDQSTETVKLGRVIVSLTNGIASKYSIGDLRSIVSNPVSIDRRAILKRGDSDLVGNFPSSTRIVRQNI